MGVPTTAVTYEFRTKNIVQMFVAMLMSPKVKIFFVEMTIEEN